MQTYIIRSGDTLQDIAARFNTTIQQIMLINRLTCPLSIFPGQIILLPIGIMPPSTRRFYYIVQPGDTVYSIAQRFNVPMMSIIRANGLAYPYLIYPGQKLLVLGATPPPPSPPASITPPTEAEYIVKPGDTLFSIAQEFNSSVEAIVSHNKIENPNLIFPGQKLVIPLTPQPRTVEENKEDKEVEA